MAVKSQNITPANLWLAGTGRRDDNYSLLLHFLLIFIANLF